MKILLSAGIACGSILLATAAPAEAVKGSNVLEVASQTISELGNGLIATQAVQIGAAIAESADDIFAGAKFHCIGTVVSDAEGTVSSNRGICLNTHANGELTWLWYNGPSDLKGDWGFLDGTGAYEGIEGTGTFWGETPGNSSYEGTWQIGSE